MRPEEEPGVVLEPQTADIVLPRDRGRLELVRDWTDGEDYIEARDAGAAAEASFVAGEAYAVLSGADLEPGIYETEGRVVAETPGVRLHGYQFTPLAPRRRRKAERRHALRPAARRPPALSCARPAPAGSPWGA